MVWQNLVRRWLYQQAGERLRETVSDAAGAKEDAHDAAADAGDEERQQHDVPRAACQVALLYDSKSAAGSLLDRLSDQVTITGAGFSAYEGSLGECRVVVAVPTQGPDASAKIAQALIAGHRPQWIVSTGFADALAPQLRRGELVMATSVADPAGGGLSCAEDASRVPAEVAATLHAGRVLAVNPPPRTAEQKQELAKQHEALATDTQSFAIAKVAAESKTHLLVIRAIRATLKDRLPTELEVLESQQSLAGKLGAVTGALMRRPGSAKDWWEQTEQTLAVADHLAETLEQIIPRLVGTDADAAASSLL